MTKRLIRRWKFEYERRLAGNIETDSKSFYKSPLWRKQITSSEITVNKGVKGREELNTITGNLKLAPETGN